MMDPMYYSLFIPVSLLTAMCTDPKVSYKLVCIGDTVEVFKDIDLINLKADITVYKIFDNKTEVIALRYLRNSSYEDKTLDKYKQKVSLENDSILIHDFRPSDVANYVMLYQTSKREEVQLCALDPPTLRCKLSIIHEENTLIASLKNPDYCGKPLAYVRWMDHPDISYRNKERIEIQTANQPRTYSACIEGETLKCITDPKKRDFCENITISSSGENNIPTIADLPQLTTTSYVILAIVVLVLCGVAAILIKLHWKRCGNRLKTEGGGHSNRTRNSTDDTARPNDHEMEFLRPEHSI